MELTVLKRMLSYPYRCSFWTKVSEKLLTFSNVVSPRATLILCVLGGHLYHLKKVREKRNSDIRGDHNLCEGRQNKKTKETRTEIPVSGEVLLSFWWQRKSSVRFRSKRWCANHIFALNLWERMFNCKNHIPQMPKKKKYLAAYAAIDSGPFYSKREFKWKQLPLSQFHIKVQFV